MRTISTYTSDLNWKVIAIKLNGFQIDFSDYLKQTDHCRHVWIGNSNVDHPFDECRLYSQWIVAISVGFHKDILAQKVTYWFSSSNQVIIILIRD